MEANLSPRRVLRLWDSYWFGREAPLGLGMARIAVAISVLMSLDRSEVEILHGTVIVKKKAE